MFGYEKLVEQSIRILILQEGVEVMIQVGMPIIAKEAAR